MVPAIHYCVVTCFKCVLDRLCYALTCSYAAQCTMIADYCDSYLMLDSAALVLF